MIKLINQTRRENGLSDLTISPVLCKAASIRVKEGSQLLSHTRPDGTHYSTVLNTAGLDTSVTKEILVWENLAYKTGCGRIPAMSAASRNTYWPPCITPRPPSTATTLPW